MDSLEFFSINVSIIGMGRTVKCIIVVYHYVQRFEARFPLNFDSVVSKIDARLCEKPYEFTT